MNKTQNKHSGIKCWQIHPPTPSKWNIKNIKKRVVFYWPLPLGYKGIERHSHTSGPFVILTWKIFWPFLFHLFTELLTWFPIQKQIHPSFPYFSLFTCFFNCNLHRVPSTWYYSKSLCNAHSLKFMRQSQQIFDKDMWRLPVNHWSWMNKSNPDFKPENNE